MTMHNTPDHTTFYTPAQLAVLLQVRRHTIYNWIRADKLTAVRAGSRVRIHRDDVVAFLLNK